jgi:Tol biopolymer transport system component
MFRTRVFWALSIAVASACAGFGQGRDVFSEPQSMLLFSGWDVSGWGGDLHLVTPSETVTVPRLPNLTGQHASPIPAISPSGDRIAWSLRFMLNADIVKCDPSTKDWCDLKPKPIYKSVMGVYSVQDKTWKQYGDFYQVGSASFSPDGKKIAFKDEADSDRQRLMILDLETGQMTPVPGSNSVIWITQLSWSPDGKFLAGSVHRYGYGQIVLIDVATGEMNTIAEGSDPSWSPKGDWIAYVFYVQCMIIHPDGTGARSVLEKEHKWMDYALDAPIVWSPEGDRLLLNQRRIYGTHTRVITVDLAAGHAILNSKDGEVVSGWVRKSGD